MQQLISYTPPQHGITTHHHDNPCMESAIDAWKLSVVHALASPPLLPCEIGTMLQACIWDIMHLALTWLRCCLLLEASKVAGQR